MKIRSLLFTVMLLLSSFTQTSYAAVPAVPSNVNVKVDTSKSYLNGSLSVTWGAVSGAGAYSIRLTRQDDNSTLVQSVTGQDTTESLFQGLVGGKTYVVQVRSIAVTEVSAWSSADLTATPKTAPKAPGTPSATAAVGQATVTWSIPAAADNGGFEIKSFLVREINSAKSLSTTADASTATFTGLTAGSIVEFTVTALNDANTTGTTSEKSAAVTLPNLAGVMSAPAIESTGTNGEAKVTWTPPASDGGSSILSYTIKLIKDGADLVTQTVTNLLDSFYTFTSLATGSYTAKIAATNGVGLNSYSVASSALSVTALVVATPTPVPTASATPAPTTPSGGSVGGGGFGGGGGFAPLPSVSESATASPKPSETPTAIATPTPSPTPIVIAVPSPSPSPVPSASPAPQITATPTTSPSTITTKTSAFTAGSAVKGATKAVTITANNEKVSTTLKTAISPVLPTIKKGTAVTVTIKGADGKSYLLASGKTTKTAAYKVPPVKFAKTGIYTMTIKVGSATKKVTITVKK